VAGLDDGEKDELVVKKQLGKVCESLIAFHLYSLRTLARQHKILFRMYKSSSGNHHQSDARAGECGVTETIVLHDMKHCNFVM